LKLSQCMPGAKHDRATGAVTPPIHLSTTFERSPDGSYPLGFSYAREGNPTRQSLEPCLAALEGGKDALAFSSGLAVATALLQGLEPRIISLRRKTRTTVYGK
jgi:cystathionine gamma-synthase